MGSSYISPKNPKDYNGDYSYQYNPHERSEYPAILHDLMYDQQKAVGVPGALLNLKTLTADELLVQNEANVAADTKNSMIDRAKALATLTAFTYIEAHKNAVCAYKQAYKEIVQSIKSIFK